MRIGRVEDLTFQRVRRASYFGSLKGHVERPSRVFRRSYSLICVDGNKGLSCSGQVPPTFESDPGDVPAAAVTTPGTAEPSWRPNEAVFGWSSAPSTGQNTSSSGHLSNKSARATTSPNAAPTGPARSSNEPHTHQKSAPSAGQKTAASPSHSDESAPAKAPASGVPGTSSQPPNCTGRSAPRADGEATPNPFPSGESAPTTAPATAPTSVRSPGVPSWPTDKPPYAVGDSRLVGERLPPSPRPSHKNASATAAMSGALGGSPRPPKQPPRVEGNAPLMKEMTPPSPLPNSHNVPANAPATAPACGTSGGRPPNQPPGAGRNAPQVGGRMAPPGLRPSSESTFATAPASRASGGPSRSSNQPPPTQKNASPLGEEAPASSLPGRGRGPSIPPASKKRGREEDEAAFVTGGSGGGVVHRKKRSATRPQNHSVSRLAPSQDVTEIFDAPGTHIYAGDVIEGDGSVVRGPEWHARFSQRGKRWRQRPKKGRTEARPRKEEPRFRQTGRGIQILVPYQRGTRPQWILLETASFDEMNRLAAVANIEPDKDVHGGTVEEIELRYRNAIREAANDFFLSSNK